MKRLFLVSAILVLLGAFLFTVGCKEEEEGSEYDLVGSWKVSSIDGVTVPSDVIFTLTFSGTSSTGSVLARLVSCMFVGNYSVTDSAVSFNFVAPSPEECDVEAGTYTFSGTFTKADEISGTMRNIKEGGNVKSTQLMVLTKTSQ